MNKTYAKVFNEVYPNFFEKKDIRSLSEDHIFYELVFDLTDGDRLLKYDKPKINVELRMCDAHKIKDAVALVNENWVKYFKRGTKACCLYCNNRLVSFCLIETKEVNGSHIGFIGCLGTLPDYRNNGCASYLISYITATMYSAEYDLVWIHYTYLDEWFSDIGFETVLEWNCRGLL